MSVHKFVSAPSPTEEATGEMARYRITRVPIDYFHFREFRYTSLADALAQARWQVEREGMAAQTLTPFAPAPNPEHLAPTPAREQGVRSPSAQPVAKTFPSGEEATSTSRHYPRR